MYPALRFVLDKPNNLMSISTSHLVIRQPSPTTILFTVSDAASQRNVSARIVFYVTCLLRVAIGLLTALLVLVKYGCGVHGEGSVPSVELCPSQLLRYIPILVAFATKYSWQLVAPVSLAILYLCIQRFYTGTVTFLIHPNSLSHP